MGHKNGRLTLNVGEAGDAHREAIRRRMHEPYRTRLGHLRHEIGHYDWCVLVAGTLSQPTFRALFGEERKDYDAALKAHHESGPPKAWQQWFVGPCAGTHPWEDFASTLAIGSRAIVSPLPLVA